MLNTETMTHIIQIDEKGYDEIVCKVIADLVSDPKIECAAKFMIPMMGSIMAAKIRTELFGERQQN